MPFLIFKEIFNCSALFLILFLALSLEVFEYPKFSKISFQVVLELIIFIKSSSEVLSKIVDSDKTLVE
jgi:hypothetical protein